MITVITPVSSSYGQLIILLNLGVSFRYSAYVMLYLNSCLKFRFSLVSIGCSPYYLSHIYSDFRPSFTCLHNTRQKICGTLFKAHNDC